MKQTTPTHTLAVTGLLWLVMCGLGCTRAVPVAPSSERGGDGAHTASIQATPAPEAQAKRAERGGDGPGCLADSCQDAEAVPPAEQRSVLGGALAPCSVAPMTGWFRDGHCRTDARDRGVHVVCGVMTDAFLSYTKAKGNDLSTPRGSFPGLKAGDRWCLCASRWEQARRDGAATPVVLEATNRRAAALVDTARLREHAAQ